MLLCGDFSAKIGRLMSEISDIRDGPLITHPALNHARRCEFACANAAGRQLVNFARVSELALGTGRVRGDSGQRTCMGHAVGVAGS